MLPLRTAKRLPDLSLPGAPDGTPVPLRSRGREGTVVALLHSADCPECLSYLHHLATFEEQLQDWDGRVVVVVPGSIEQATALHEQLQVPFQILADADGACADRCGVPQGSMVIADQWGEVFHVYSGSPENHDFPTPEEVVEWLRFMAIQCPECQGEAW